MCAVFSLCVYGDLLQKPQEVNTVDKCVLRTCSVSQLPLLLHVAVGLGPVQ